MMELFCILTTVVIIQHRPVCLRQANRIVGKLHLKKAYLKKNLGAPGWHVTLDLPAMSSSPTLGVEPT